MSASFGIRLFEIENVVRSMIRVRDLSVGMLVLVDLMFSYDVLLNFMFWYDIGSDVWFSDLRF